MIGLTMQVLTFRAVRNDNIYFRTIEEREKINSRYSNLPQENRGHTILSIL